MKENGGLRPAVFFCVTLKELLTNSWTAFLNP